VRVRSLLLGAASGLALAKVAGDAALRRYETINQTPSLGPGKHAKVLGADVHYVEAGEGPALLLIHGLGASTFSYRKNIAALGRRFRTVALDLPGFGFSTRSVPGLSLTAQARYVAAFLDALGIENASLAGHSMGGTVVQRFALNCPERVERLVLIDSTTDAQMRSAAWLSRPAKALLPAFVSFVLHFKPVRLRWLGAAVYDRSYLTPEVLSGYAAPGRVRGNVAAFQRLLIDRTRDAPIDASRIRAPTLILWGEADRIVRPAVGQRLHEEIPGSQLIIVPKAGHWVPEEQPEAVNHSLIEFLTAQDDPRETARSAIPHPEHHAPVSGRRVPKSRLRPSAPQ
jgi:pimeloyl-ACP methyl ester carboxylesterase